MKTKTSFLYLLSFIFCLFLRKAFAKATAFKAAALCSVLCALSFTPCALSQIPQGFNYQAIARDGTGAVLPNTSLQAMMYVQSLSTGGTIFWKELHSTITTNSFGLFTLTVGTGARQTASTVATFNLIDWSVTPKYLKTEIYYSGSWKDMGTSQLMTVPYSMTAGDIVGTVDKLAVKGTTSALDEALFEVKNKNGQTIFAVYNEGVRIYVDDGAKGPKGGFAVGGFDMTKATKQEYLVVSDDSVRIYVDSNPLTKGKKSGFAVGGYDVTKAGTIQNYLDVSADSVRVYIDSNPATKKLKGGFAVGGYDMTKKVPQDILRVTYDSTRIYINDTPGKAVKSGFAVGGYDATKAIKPKYLSVTSLTTNVQVKDTLKGFSVTNIQSGAAVDFMKIDKLNSFIGHETGPKTVPSTTGEEGKYNVFLGYQSGKENITGYKNVYMGYHSGLLSTSARHNTFIGNLSGVSNQIGQYNTFLGSNTGAFNTASENTFVGCNAGVMNSTGQHNTFVGMNSGTTVDINSDNTFLGWGSGNANNGSNNVFLGSSSGSSNTTGSGNVYIGYNTNRYTGCNSSNRLLINNYNGSSYTPLIYGEFDNRRVVINGKHTDNPSPYYTFWVNGTAGGSAAWFTPSDAKMKKEITTITDALSKVLKIRGVSFEWKDTTVLEKGRRIGFIAQEVETILPEVVSKSDDTFLMQYAPITALLVEAVKEQQKIIDDQKAVIRDHEKTIEGLQSGYDEIFKEIENIKTRLIK
jgi:hypothetical protein